MRKLILATGLLLLLGACAELGGTPKVESTSDGMALATISLTSVAKQVTVLKQQGVLVGKQAQTADLLLNQSRDAINAGWTALGNGDEPAAISALRIAQGINAQLILLINQQKGTSNGKIRGDCERTGDCAGSTSLGGRNADALQRPEGEGSGRGPYHVYA